MLGITVKLDISSNNNHLSPHEKNIIKKNENTRKYEKTKSKLIY